jgi:hypothetical protein
VIFLNSIYLDKISILLFELDAKINIITSL